jgi:hypothetical protein
VGAEVRYEIAAVQDWIREHARSQEPPSVELDEPRNSEERRWKAEVESTDWAFEASPTNELTHHLHPYPAKFPPPLPRRLIEILTSPGDTVLDPFCGSGTTLVEAKTLGRAGIGIDSNPVAVLATEAKTAVLTKDDLLSLEELAVTIETDAEREGGRLTLLAPVLAEVEPLPAPAIPNLDRWFSEQAKRELGLLLARIADISRSSPLMVARACFSAILVQASNQDSETRYTAKPRQTEPGEIVRLFGRKVLEAVRMHEAWARVASPVPAKALLGDTRTLSQEEVGIADAVVTSPPYANAFDYHLYHRHRLFWLGFDPSEVRRVEIGSHLNHQGDSHAVETYERDMTACLKAIATCLPSGRPLAFVVGDSIFSGQLINNAAVLSEAGRSLGLHTLACVDRTIHASKRSMITAARRAREEHVLLLVKD